MKLKQTAVLVLLAVLLVLVGLMPATAADTLRSYGADSAHGNAATGVNRNSLPNSPVQVYATGNCAHCHEQHGLINGSEVTPSGGNGPYAVFSAGMGNSDNFCLNCHTTSGGVQGVTNYNYSRRFGGYTSSTADSIRAAFPATPGALGTAPSGHNLGSIADWAYVFDSSTNPWAWVKSGGTNATNPCLACHDVHRSMQTVGPPAYDPTKTNLILPQAHNPAHADGLFRHLWGDDDEQRTITRVTPSGHTSASCSERLSDLRFWASGQSEVRIYQSPYRLGGGYEDGGTGDGSTLPNSTELCLACHRVAVTGVKRIRWDQTATAANRDIHGLGEEEHPCAYMGDLRPPYVDTTGQEYPCPSDPKRAYNYVVGCLDCHEPHGSALPYMLREEVNGHVVNAASITSTYWKDFCAGCHDWSYDGSSAHQEMSTMTNCKQCHYHGARPDYYYF